MATIGGDSAGGHLSAVTLLRLRDRHAITGAFAAANLIYGAFDLSMTPSQRLWGERNLILSTPILHYFGDMFLPGLGDEARRDPGHLAALRRAAATCRPRSSPSARWTRCSTTRCSCTRAGSPRARRAELRTWPEAIHGFNAFPLRVTAAARAEQYAFLRDAVGAA